MQFMFLDLSYESRDKYGQAQPPATITLDKIAMNLTGNPHEMAVNDTAQTFAINDQQTLLQALEIKESGQNQRVLCTARPYPASTNNSLGVNSENQDRGLSFELVFIELDKRSKDRDR